MRAALSTLRMLLLVTWWALVATQCHFQLSFAHKVVLLKGGNKWLRYNFLGVLYIVRGGSSRVICRSHYVKVHHCDIHGEPVMRRRQLLNKAQVLFSNHVSRER